MAQLISEIKKQMTDVFIAQPAVVTLYELDINKTFEEQFSKVSLESMLFYCVAVDIWVLQKLFDVFKTEVETELDTKMPHRVKWYQEKVLRFQYPNRDLITDSDKYDNTSLSADEIAELEIVKFCAVEDKLSELRIKVAKGEAGSREPLENAELLALEYYLNEIKDAGVKIVIVNQQADKITAQIDVYFNPLILNPATNPALAAFKAYTSNLDFNGEITANGIEDSLQAIAGVKLVNVKEVYLQRASNAPELLEVRAVAESGYYVVENDSYINITYIPYASL